MLAFIKNLFFPRKPNAATAWAFIQSKVENKAEIKTYGGYWLYAAPVHLVLQRDSFSLAAPAPLLLEPDEISALTALFNQHFGVDEKSFFWHKNNWFLRLENNPNMQTCAPEAAFNKDISAYLPTGEGAIQWAKFTNEIQMLLFDHPINLAREAKKLPVINSIWCYSGGQGV